MADNYLERKMEDYRRGSTAARRLTHSGDAPGTLRVKLRRCPLLLTDAEGEADELLISMLAGAGFKVAFTMADAANGRALASRVGALYLPSAEGAGELLRRRWMPGPVAGDFPLQIIDRAARDSVGGSPLTRSLRLIADIIDGYER